MTVFCDGCAKPVPAHDDYFTASGGAECGGCKIRDRIWRAKKALSRYYENAEEEGLETVLTDFVADAMHFADAEGIDWEQLLWRAEMHFTEERARRI